MLSFILTYKNSLKKSPVEPILIFSDEKIMFLGLSTIVFLGLSTNRSSGE